MKKIEDKWICDNSNCINYNKTPIDPKNVDGELTCPNASCKVPLTNPFIVAKCRKKKLIKRTLYVCGGLLLLGTLFLIYFYPRSHILLPISKAVEKPISKPIVPDKTPKIIDPIRNIPSDGETNREEENYNDNIDTTVTFNYENQAKLSCTVVPEGNYSYTLQISTDSKFDSLFTSIPLGNSSNFIIDNYSTYTKMLYNNRDAYCYYFRYKITYGNSHVFYSTANAPIMVSCSSTSCAMFNNRCSN